ncbi:hypothetical protein GPECTOR_41g612 [Gonium pectorale]|uniref:Uncharacterized protein n=1 Tax=Gonium pectorale TaxID=33097 RepID=A0A150G9Z4_GONPE|nr:hypothetical protein GPECTOR_41g612 [Gonium pectorale]|eukprot:KXZ46648.1 hypothetical protein GPECTOR_41g612 [Gonium pectorale]
MPLVPAHLGFGSCRDLIAAAPQAAAMGPPPEQRVTAVLTHAGAEELFHHVRWEVEHPAGVPEAAATAAAGPPPQTHVSYELVMSAMGYYLAGSFVVILMGGEVSGPVPDAAIPRISAYDVAAAVRRCVTRCPPDESRAAAAAGVASSRGASLVCQVLQDVSDVAAAAAAAAATAGGGAARDASPGGPIPPRQKLPAWELAQQLSWQMGVVVSDLLLYVNIAIAAIEDEKQAALRGAAGLARAPAAPPSGSRNPQHQPPQPQPHAAKQPQAQPKAQQHQAGRGSTASHASAASAAKQLEPHLAPQHHQYLSPPQQAALSRRQLKDMFIPHSRDYRPGSTSARREQQSVKAFARGVADALAALREAEEKEREERALATAGGEEDSDDEPMDLCSDSSNSSDSSSEDGGKGGSAGDDDDGGGHKGIGGSGGGDGGGKGAAVGAAGGAPSAQDFLDNLPVLPMNSLDGAGAHIKGAIAEANGLPVNFTDAQLQAAAQRVLQQALGGPRVQPEPAPGFYASVIALVVQQFIGPALRADAKARLDAAERALPTQRPGSKLHKRMQAVVAKLRRPESQAKRLALTERKAAGHPLVAMLLRALHAAMRGQLPVHEAQMAAVRQQQSQQQGAAGGAASGPAAAQVAAAQAAAAQTAGRRDAAGGSESGSGEESEDPDAPYIRDAAGRAAMRQEALRASARAARRGSRADRKAQVVVPEAALRGVVAAFKRVEAALAAARPASGWSPEALGYLREGIFAPGAGTSPEDAAAGGGCGDAGPDGDRLFSAEKLRALSTFVDFLLQRPPRQQAGQGQAAGLEPPRPAQAAGGHGSAQAPGVRRPAVPRAAVLAALRAAVLELREGCSLASLAALERRVAQRLAAQLLPPEPLEPPMGSAGLGGSCADAGGGEGAVFAALGLGPSLLSALEASADGELLSALAGDADGPVRAPLYQVLSLVAEVLRACRLTEAGGGAVADGAADGGAAPSPAAAAATAAAVVAAHAPAVSRALCAHYGVPRVECLGHGPAGHLCSLALREGATPPVGWHSVVALAPPPGGDLVAGGIAALELPSEPAAGGPALELAAGGRLVKLPHGATAADVVARAAAGDARGAVAALLSVVAAGGGVGGCPAALLARHLGEALADVARQAASRSELAGDAAAVAASRRDARTAADSAGAAAVCRLVLAALPHLPQPLLAPLAEAVLLPALATALESCGTEASREAAVLGGGFGGDGAAQPVPRNDTASGGAWSSSSLVHESLLRQAAAWGGAGGVARSCLHHLGFALGVEAWQEDWKRLYGTDDAASSYEAGADQPPLGPAGAEEGVAAAASAASTGASSSAAAAARNDGDAMGALAEDAAPVTAPAAAQASLPLSSAAVTVTPSERAAAAGGGGAAAGVGVGPLEAPMAEDECRRFVESIRRDEFGVGVQLDGEAAELSGRLTARTGRALQRLAAELYSTDSHFVMELVQNADDNAYPAGVVPSLEFVLQRGAVIAANNEHGFGPQHLRALCDVGASTKARVTGYIGQKGIGFKSVFRVTAAPQVHSRNFHVCFDLSRHGSLGYCLPDWCPLPPGSAATAALARLGCRRAASPASEREAAASFPYGTAIVLPLRQDMAAPHQQPDGAGGAGGAGGGPTGGADRGAVLRRRFADISPTLLLFLQRLQRIRVRDETAVVVDEQAPPSPVGTASGNEGGGGVRVVEMERRLVEGQPHLVQLLVREVAATAAAAGCSEGGMVSVDEPRWAVVTARIQPTVPRSGVAVSETQVSLAFCLGQGPGQVSDGAGAGAGAGPPSLLAPSWRTGRPPQQPVFAFLPLRSYGLRFVVQADWVVPSSREALDADSPWNQVLRAQLPGLFLRALDVFKGLPPPAAPLPRGPGNMAAETGGGGSAAQGTAQPALSAGGAELYWVDQWLRCVPLEGEAQGFFAGLPHRALYDSRQLRALLGVRDFGPAQLLDVLRAVQVAAPSPSPGMAGHGDATGGPGAEPSRAALHFLDERFLSEVVDGAPPAGSEAGAKGRAPLGDQERSLLFDCLEELGVRHLRIEDVVFGLALPALTAWRLDGATPAAHADGGSHVLLPVEGTAREELPVSYLALCLLSGVLRPAQLPLSSSSAAAAASAAAKQSGAGARGSLGLGTASAEQQQQQRRVLQLLRRRCTVATSRGVLAAVAMAEAPAGGDSGLYLPASLLGSGGDGGADPADASPQGLCHVLPLLPSAGGGGGSGGKRGRDGARGEQQLSAAAEWTFLSDTYVRRFPELTADWRWLFAELGVAAFPRPTRALVQLSAADLQTSLTWRHLRNGPALSGPGPWVVEDWVCPPLMRLLRLATTRAPAAASSSAATEGRRSRAGKPRGPAAPGSDGVGAAEAGEATILACQRLFLALAANWEHFAPAMEARMAAPPHTAPDGGAAAGGTLGGGGGGSDGASNPSLGHSSLAAALRSAAWLPAELQQQQHAAAEAAGEGADAGLRRLRVLLPPTEVYAPLPAISSLLDVHVPYVELPLVGGADAGGAAGGGFDGGPAWDRLGPGAKTMLRQLGVASEVTPQIVLRLLLRWSRGGSAATVDNRRFTASLAVMERLYSFIQAHLQQQQQDASSGPPTSWYEPLVRQEPCVHDYLECLRRFAAAAAAAAPRADLPAGGGSGVGAAQAQPQLAPPPLPPPPLPPPPPAAARARDAALRILAHWARQHAAGLLGPDQLARLRLVLQAEPLLPCASGRWCRLGPRVLWNDDPLVAEALAGPAGLEFLLLPDAAEERGAAGDAGGLEPSATAAAAAGSAPTAQAAGGAQGGSPTASLLRALGVEPLSRHVSMRVEYDGSPAYCTTVETAVRQTVLAAESYLSSMLAETEEFSTAQAAVENMLPDFRVMVVPSFTATLRFLQESPAAAPGPGHHGKLPAPARAASAAAAATAATAATAAAATAATAAAEAVVRPPALMAGPTLYVLASAATAFVTISRELSRLFRGGTPWPELADRMLGALLTAAAGGSVAQLLEHQGMRFLPPPPLPSAAPPAPVPGGSGRGGARYRRWQLPPMAQPPPPPPLPCMTTAEEAAGEAAPKRGSRKRSAGAAGLHRRAEEHGAEGAAAGQAVADVDASGQPLPRPAAGALAQQRGAGGSAGSCKRRRVEGSGEGADGMGDVSGSSSRSGEERDGEDSDEPSSSSLSGSDSGSGSEPEERDGAGDAARELRVGTAQRRPSALALASTQGGHPAAPLPAPFSGGAATQPYGAAQAVEAVTYEQPTAKSSADRMRAASGWWARSQQRLERKQEQGASQQSEEEKRLKAIGRWGEELVFRHLVTQLDRQQRSQLQTAHGGGAPTGQGQPAARAGSVAADRVVWVNRERESYMPYDIYIQHADESTTYIEVKTSTSNTKDLFEISLAELRFAEDQGSQYVLYRVRGAGGPNPVIVRHENPVNALRKHSITLCIAV